MRFSLLQLLLFVAVIALSLATFGPWGIAITIFLGGQTLLRRRAVDRVALIVVWGLVFVLGSCMLHRHWEAVWIWKCKNHYDT